MSLPITAYSARSLVLAAAVVLVNGACTDKNTDPAPTATTGFSWTADNTNYTSTSSEITDTGLTITLTGTCVSASGRNTIRLSIPPAVGTYNTAAPTYPAYWYMAYLISAAGTSGVSTAYVASNAAGTAAGTVTITTLSATDIVGTFSFTGEILSGTATKAVTNGKFNLKR